MRRIIATLALTAAALGTMTAPAAADLILSKDCVAGGGQPVYDPFVGTTCMGGTHDGAVVLGQPELRPVT
jgi:Spy/CpxP family protein refolding chaperone